MTPHLLFLCPSVERSHGPRQSTTHQSTAVRTWHAQRIFNLKLRLELFREPLKSDGNLSQERECARVFRTPTTVPRKGRLTASTVKVRGGKFVVHYLPVLLICETTSKNAMVWPTLLRNHINTLRVLEAGPVRYGLASQAAKARLGHACMT